MQTETSKKKEQTTLESTVSNIRLGRLEALLSSVFFAWIFYFIKASNHSTAQLAFVRGSLNVIILYIHSLFSKDDLFASWYELD